MVPRPGIQLTRNGPLITRGQSGLDPYEIENPNSDPNPDPASKADDDLPLKPEFKKHKVEKPKKRRVKLNLNQPDFPPFFRKFYASFPSRAADVGQVRQWLSSWFDAQGAFENDVGVDEYVGRLVLNGQDVREGKFLRYFLGDMNLKQNSQFYDSAIISAFADDIERARLVRAVERDEPGARENWEKSKLVNSSRLRNFQKNLHLKQPKMKSLRCTSMWIRNAKAEIQV
ncbi:hypothetical protein GLAREA_06165 [Glarea lozoyensis ATCC 20868]|uniref:Uncharacterized protein n=1 Tax=Glarea lozoyensis (strain ATCC 20868 / MF5171) TaxID=1116229 RepID=S3E3X3_GLAL2|nr:uncharacterized protein GLAREA_06165 [Glarea lozoyensis ATCC 20868]EPE33153.1 hypothetical protein GLAREA_06165 [Glarea lozoyensis ATCC 20868]